MSFAIVLQQQTFTSATNIHFQKSSSTMRIANCRNDNHYIFLPFRNSTSVVRIADYGTIWLFTISSSFRNVDCRLQKTLNFFTFKFNFLLSTIQISDCRNPLYIIYILTLFLLPQCRLRVVETLPFLINFYSVSASTMQIAGSGNTPIPYNFLLYFMCDFLGWNQGVANFWWLHCLRLSTLFRSSLGLGIL